MYGTPQVEKLVKAAEAAAALKNTFEAQVRKHVAAASKKEEELRAHESHAEKQKVNLSPVTHA